MGEEKLPDFSGQLVQLHLTGTGASRTALDMFLLEYPEWEEVGGRLFIVGRVPEVSDGADWTAGRQAAVAWDSVSSYVVFRSREEYQESASRYKPSLRERLGL